MVKATDGVYKYVEGGFAVRHKKDGFKASLSEVLLGRRTEVRIILGWHAIKNKNINQKQRRKSDL